MSPRIGEVRSRTIAQWTKIADVALPIQRIIPRCRNFDPELNINSMFDNSVWCLRDKRDAIVEIFVIETRRNEKFCCYLLGYILSVSETRYNQRAQKGMETILKLRRTIERAVTRGGESFENGLHITRNENSWPPLDSWLLPDRAPKKKNITGAITR